MNMNNKSYDIGYLETLAAQDSLMHGLDPRAMVITTMAFIVVVVSFNKYAFAALIPFILYPIVIIASGGLPIGYFLKKVLLVSPFAVVIGIFNPIIDREILFHIGNIGISGGWLSFLSIILRCMLTVTAALVLVSVTGFNAVCASLIKLGVPRIFVIQLLFCYRYLFVLSEEGNRMARARSIRTFSQGKIGFRVYVSLIGHLLIRTLERAERVYRAMLCRGFKGDIRLIRHMRIRSREIVFVAGWILLFLICRYFNVPQIIGAFVTGVFS